MEVVITEWALDSYLTLKARNVFTPEDYRDQIRPAVELLKTYPHPATHFTSNNFWGPATLRGGVAVPGGFKMKWHNLGPGHVQLRLCVAMLDKAYLCQAFVKTDDAKDKREAANLEIRIASIRKG